jgi:ethanolamine ammonia-lyase large subunit
MLVNSVVGFIGPEYLFDGKQIIRAGLEDHFCGKLIGADMPLAPTNVRFRR